MSFTALTPYNPLLMIPCDKKRPFPMDFNHVNRTDQQKTGDHVVKLHEVRCRLTLW